MNKKEWLERYRSLQTEAERTERELQRWRSRAERVTQRLSDMPKGGERRNKLEDAVCAMEELEDTLMVQILKAIAVRQEIAAAIEAVQNPVSRELLKRRYIDGDKWESIAEKMNYCYKHVVHTLHPRALAEVVIESNAACVI